MAYTSHLNPLLKGIRRTATGVALDLTVYVYPEGYGYVAPKGQKKGEHPLALSDQAQLCANLSNVVGLMHRAAKKNH